MQPTGTISLQLRAKHLGFCFDVVYCLPLEDSWKFQISKREWREWNNEMKIIKPLQSNLYWFRRSSFWGCQQLFFFFYLEKLLLAIVFGIDKNPLNDAPLRPYPFISLMIADKNEKFVPPPLPDCERRDISLSANKGEKWIRKDFSSRIIREIFPSIPFSSVWWWALTVTNRR